MVSGIHCETCESAFELLNAFVKNMVILTVAMQKDQRPSAAADLIIETYAVHINHHNCLPQIHDSRFSDVHSEFSKQMSDKHDS